MASSKSKSADVIDLTESDVIDLTETPIVIIDGIESPEEKKPPQKSSSPDIPEIAKKRLSKWAARLFDPNRPKGVIQPPKTIPLNDEFLKAFGRREQQTDAELGVSLEIDRAIPDEDDEKTDKDETKATKAAPLKPTAEQANEKNVKVKISNIRFSMVESQLEYYVERFGPLEKVQIIQNPDDPSKNLGFGYVTFQDSISAKKCVDELKVIQERNVTVTFARSAPKRGKGTSSNIARYYTVKEEDLSTVCYHCGKVGHMARECQNPKLSKPCTLCGWRTHDTRSCPSKIFCFKCGFSGHTSKECKSRNTVPPRLCTNCYGTDHHKSQCRRRAECRDVKSAICMTCGNIGHFSCRRVSFFYGLRGLCCCNCGAVGHTIHQCRAPKLSGYKDTGPVPLGHIEWPSAKVQATINFMNDESASAGRYQQHYQSRPPDRRKNNKRRRMM